MYGNWGTKPVPYLRHKQKTPTVWKERRLGKTGSGIFVKFQMCWYHVTLHVDLELEHTLDVLFWGP